MVRQSEMGGDHWIRIETSRARARVEFNGVRIADSARALVLHETRLPPAYYFPVEDVRMDLLARTAHTTHCPFKGNASYWSVKVGDHVAENAAWAYEEPYREAEPVRGYLSFYRDKVSVLHEREESTAIEEPHANPLASWLVNEGWKAGSSAELAERFLKSLRDAGVPVDRSTVIIPTLHPQIFATVLVWRADTPGIRTVFEPHDILQQPKFADSPFAPIIRGAGGVRRRLEDPDCALDFPVVRELKAEGATDYVAMPFRFSDGQINVMSMTSFAPGGFSSTHLGQLYEVLQLLARLYEVHATRRTATALLETYLGRHTGERVLKGLVKHGDGEHIHAVIWFCDFRDSTPLSKSMGRQAYLRQLNRFFFCMAGAVLEAGGEVLRYIGDAVLAIFPIAGNEREACEKAVRAAQIAADRIKSTNQMHPERAPLRYGIGLHLGTVTYGNIGVPERLEFTVIGAAANEAARIESMTKELRKPVLTSAAFAAAYQGALISLSKHPLKGLDGEHELFTLPDDPMKGS
jgi:adenylate cyclase